MNKSDTTFSENKRILKMLKSFGLTPATEPPAEKVKTKDKAKPKGIQLKTMTMAEVFLGDFPAPEYILGPWLRVGDSAIISAKAGVGKSFFALEIARAIATGGTAFAGRWKAAKARKVLYLDGEMGAADMQGRIHRMMIDQKNIIYMDGLSQSDDLFLNLANPEHQKAVLDKVEENEVAVVIIDNLSTLYTSPKESNSAESWDAMKRFILRLRGMGIAVVVIDHEGKGSGAGPRGTSAKLDIVHTVISLERPEDYSPKDGLRFNLRFVKHRGFYGEDAAPFTVRLLDGEWIVSEVVDVPTENSKPKSETETNREIMYQKFDEDMTPKEVMEETGFSRSTVYDHYKKWRAERGEMDAVSDSPADPSAEIPNSGSGFGLRENSDSESGKTKKS